MSRDPTKFTCKHCGKSIAEHKNFTPCSDDSQSKEQVRAELEADGVDVDGFLRRIKSTIQRTKDKYSEGG